MTRDEAGKALSMFGTHTDITDLKKAEQKLRVAEETYRNVFLNAQVGMFRTDIETGLILDANDAALRALGYTRSEIPAIQFSSLLDEDQVIVAFRAMEEALQEGTLREAVEFKLKRRDGGSVWVQADAKVLRRHGEPYGIQGVALDITSRKRGEEALRQSEERYRSLVNNSPDLIYVLDGFGKIRKVNDAGRKYFGYDREEEVIGKDFSPYIHEEDRERVVHSFLDALFRP